jgi:hypothetical protein
VEGLIFGLINSTMNGTVDIAIDESKIVETGMFCGLGNIQITVQLYEGTKTVLGTQFFILTIVKNTTSLLSFFYI